MSTFLSFSSYLIPIGGLPEDVKSAFRSQLLAAGWQIAHESAPITAVIPGTLGNNGSFPGANAFDIDSATTCATTSALPLWVGVQAAAGFTPTRMTIQGDSTTSGYAPCNFDLDYSDDGVTWYVLQSWAGEVNWGLAERRVYTVTGAGSHIYWRLNVSANNGGPYTSITSIVLEDVNHRQLSTSCYLMVIPPSTETIGTSASHELTFIEIFNSSTRITPILETLVDQHQTVALHGNTAGAVACGMTLSAASGAPFNVTASISGTTMTVTAGAGLTVGSPISGTNVHPGSYIASFGSGSGGLGTYNLNVPSSIGSTSLTANAAAHVVGATGSTGSTANQNLRSLYEAIQQSSDPNILNFTWEYQYAPPQNNADGVGDYIYGYCATSGINIPILGNVNTTAVTIGSRQQATHQTPHTSFNGGGSLDCTIDLINGFVYYLQICSRSIALATKTVGGFYGPIHAAYSPNARALAAMPVAPTFGPQVNMIELVVGYDGAANVISSNFTTAHFWGMPAVTYNGAQAPVTNSYSAPVMGGASQRDKFCDLLTASSSNGTPQWATLWGSGFSANDGATAEFQVHRQNQIAMTQVGNLYLASGTLSGVGLIPILDIPDWYKFRGTATSESLLLIADTVTITTLNQSMDATTAYTSLTLTSTTGFPNPGGTVYVVIENEVIGYTGITGNTLTGVTRAQFGSVKAMHFLNTVVNAGLWVTVINGGALLCGYVKP